MNNSRKTVFPTASIVEMRNILSESLKPCRISIRRIFDGTIDIRILADAFKGVDEPEEIVKKVLAKAERELPERTLLFLKAPADMGQEEANLVFSSEPVSTPTWGDALLREPEEEIADVRDFECKVVAFWGLKGGVGRSTALSHVSSLLGRRIKVLALDLDLDSPGLVATLSDDLSMEGRPRFEELIKAAGSGSSDKELEENIIQALRRGKDVNSRVDVLGPVSADAKFVQALLGPLAPASLYRGGQPALRRLLRAAIRASEAEIVLVDTRSGYCDESAMTILDLADEIAFFASPAPSTFVSMEPAIYALERNRRALGRPTLVHVVAGMMPAGEEARRRIHDELRVVMEHARAGVNADLGATSDGELPPDIEILPIDYASRIVENEGRLILGAIDGYRELAERLVPVDISASAIAPEPGWGRDVLREADIPVAQAENEENFEKLAELFTSTRDLHDFVRHEVCLVLGAKGTGKSYLRRMCLEHKDTLTRRSATKALENTIFVDGYSQLTPSSTSMPPITRDVLRELDHIKGRNWSHIWSALALGRTIARMRSSEMEIDFLREGKRKASLALDRLAGATSAQSISSAVRKLIQEPLVLDEIWNAIDRTCSRAGKTLTLLFDDLDVALGESMRDIRRRTAMIEGLLDRANVSWVSRRHLAAKIFLREDIFRSLNVEEEAKYATRRVVLNWAQEEIWRLVVRAMAVASSQFSKQLASIGIDRERLEECTEHQRLSALALIWGDRMGEGESNTRSTAWVWGRLHDGAGRMFPRAALWLLRFALEQRRKRSLDDKLPLLDPPALRAAIPLVATERLAELKKECSPEERRRIELLRGFNSYQDEVKFLRALKNAGEEEPGEALKIFKTLGIVETGSRRNGTPTVRIVDLYAFAPEIEINRLGRR